MSAPPVGRIATLIQAEFREMPGMRLTEPQIRRLWNLTPAETGAAIDQLVRCGQLVRDDSGRYAAPREG